MVKLVFKDFSFLREIFRFEKEKLAFARSHGEIATFANHTDTYGCSFTIVKNNMLPTK